MLKKEVIEKTFEEIKPLGLKSVLFAGSGEPLLHPDFSDIVNATKQMGIDVALSTNGVLLKSEIVDKCLKNISWIRFSVSGGTEKTYKKIHRGKDGDLQKVFDNIKYAAEFKRKNNYDTVLNVQIVMIPENVDEMITLARKVKECGADRFIVKSLGTMYATENSTINDVTMKFYQNNDSFYEELMSLNDDKYEVVYRKNRMHNTFSKKNYSSCYAYPFHGCIDAEGCVVPCCNFMGVKEFTFGNINNQSFVEIWDSDSHKNVMKKLEDLKLKPCTMACKLDTMNRFLKGFVYLDKHINFI